MFERFTEKAIKVIMLAQEESRRLGHNFVGTEQILLALIGEGTGIAGRVLKSMGVTLKEARIEVEKIIGRGSGFVAVEIPFTPRAKRVLEMALEECRVFGPDYVGTEHLMLGLVREEESVATRVLENLGVDPTRIRDQVMQMPDFGRPKPRERLSMQPYRESLRELLPRMSNNASKVWHALGSQVGWEDTDVGITTTQIMKITHLSERAVLAALKELVELKVITRIESP